MWPVKMHIVSVKSTFRQFQVMAAIFGVVVLLVGIFLGWAALNPSKPETPEQHLTSLNQGRDHSVTPHIHQLADATAGVKTSWEKGVLHYKITVNEPPKNMAEWLSAQPKYCFIITWYAEDKPVAQILVPFKSFHADESSRDKVFSASGGSAMNQSTYEKIYSSKSWGLDWGPVPVR